MAYIPPHRRRPTEPENIKHRNENELNTKMRSSDLENAIDFVYCINLDSRPDKLQAMLKEIESTNSEILRRKLQRFPAVHCTAAASEMWDSEHCVVRREWDATTNAKYVGKISPGLRSMTAGEIGCALSHVALWRKLVAEDSNPAGRCKSMMVLEDDAVFTKKRGTSRFVAALEEAWCKLAEVDGNNWGLLYLGFSSRGKREYVETIPKGDPKESHPWRAGPHSCRSSTLNVQLYKPEYGFHTHAYVIKQAAAASLLDHLPIRGPIDVWLADNNWFNVPVYCAVIANEGWKNDDGTYEGVGLVSQNRKGFQSDVAQSFEA